MCRKETAAAVLYLIETIQTRARFHTKRNALRVLDLCTGTGCIPLLLAHEFDHKRAATSLKLERVLGADISWDALTLANQNWRSQFNLCQNRMFETSYKPWDPTSMQSLRRHHQEELLKVDFVRADIMSEPSPSIPQRSPKSKRRLQSVTDLCTGLKSTGRDTEWDLLICNPPYISPKHFETTTSRSVRNYEPKLALVPPPLKPGLTDEQQGDLFYPRLLHLADKFKSQMLLMEVADLAQAERVAAMAQERESWSGVEIWCDQPGMPWRESSLCNVPLIGQGHGRSVFCWREMEMRSTPSLAKQAVYC